MSDNKLLTSFLQDLLKKIEAGEMSEENLRRVSEFLISYKFQESRCERQTTSETPTSETPTSETPVNSDNTENPFRDEELTKYAYLGWYIYSQLNNK